MPLLQANDLSKTYSVAGRAIPVLANIGLAVEPAEFLVIQGSSGSGKSTLLSILSGLDRPDAGQVLFDGHDLCVMDEDALAPLRNRWFGFVFQAFHLVPSLTVRENVMFPAELNRDRQARSKAETLLNRVGLGDRLDSFPEQLSGGEMQRCAICRALVNGPRILFADEPTGSLDSTNGRMVLDLLLELRQERQSALVLVTHSEVIASRADRVVLLADGRLAPHVP